MTDKEHDVNRRSRARLWLIRHLPSGMIYHPAEWLFASLCAISGVRVVFWGAESASLEALLPPPLYFVWGLMLTIGAIAHMSGLLSIRAVGSDRYVVTRVPAYRLGLRLLGASTSMYAAALMIYAGQAGLLAAVFPLAFSGMCGLRLLALGGR